MTRRFARAALVFVLVGAAGLAVRMIWMRARPRGPNVILVVADTLRPDRLGAYGDRRGLTPFLDQLAARGILFEHAYATSSWTCPSVASLFTSRYPSQHRVHDFDSKLPEDEVTLAERLAGHRYFTAAFSANFRLSKELGYAQGFNLFNAYVSYDKVTVRQLEDETARWLDWAKDGAGHPLFLYFHLMETHSPYDPDRESRDPEELALRRRVGPVADGARVAMANTLLDAHRWQELQAADVSLLESLYDVEVALLDFRLRRLFAELERRGILRNAIVIFTADHGEEFRDHGLLLHGTSLFNELIHVPLIVVPAGPPQVARVEEDVSLVDVAPTLLALLDLPPEPRFEGRPLLPITGGHPDVLAEYLPISDPNDINRHSLAFLRGSVKLVVPRNGGDAAPVLYDLTTDPYETHPDPPALVPQRAALSEAAAHTVAALAERAGTAERGQADERMRARLRALGYAN